MNKLIFYNGEGKKFKSEMLAAELETAAIILARPVKVSPQQYRLLVSEIVTVPQEAYERRTGDSIVIRPEFLAAVIKKARHHSLSIIMAHTHPWDGYVRASPIDTEGERVLLPTLFSRVPNVPHGRLVLGNGGYDAMIKQTTDECEQVLELFDVGSSLERLPRQFEEAGSDETFNRQVRAFGAEGQRKLESFRVAVVGLGGTGSVVIEQLAHLGCKDFLLIDSDHIEQSNLNRVVGATRMDVGRPKVDVAKQLIAKIRPDARVGTIEGSVLSSVLARRLLEADIFFCCTDSHGSRAVLTQLAYQYLLPAIDLGVQIEVRDGVVTHVTGRVQMLAPGLSCLVCSDLLNPAAVRRDLMTEDQRRADRYIVGDAEPQPAVISINATVASLAVTMFLSAVAGIPARSRYQIYRAETGVVRSIDTTPLPTCVICSPGGALARGDSWPTPGRPE